MPRPVLARRARTLTALAAVAALALTAMAEYTVRAGDTLSGIAVRHGVRTADLASHNGISDPNRIRAGDRLRLPGSGGGAPQAAASGAGTHTVAFGENLTTIARRYGVGVRDLARANNITDPNMVRAGQRLAIPSGAAAARSSAPAPAAGSAPAGTASRAEVGRLLEQTAQRYGMSPSLVKAIAWQESGWSNSRVSSAGALGIMQVMPATGQWVSRSLVGRPLDLRDPADNVEAGVAFLRYLHRTTGGDLRMMLAGYYQGLGSVQRYGLYPSTERYIANVVALRARF
jgi:N-acetylmuramoyl-L-alanine amidase